MSDIKTADISTVAFESAVFPTVRDMTVWNGLTPEQQRAVILRDIEEGLQGPAAQKSSKDEIMAEARAELNRAL